MIRDVILPQLAMGMSEGTILEWAVAEGDAVKRDQNLVVIETEKVATDLPAPYTGFVHFIAKVGDTLPIETIIAKIADSQEEYQTLLLGAGRGGAVAPATAPVAIATTATVSSPLPAPLQTATGIGSETPKKPRVSGLAKAIARKNSLDLVALTGSGPGGRIVRRDVLAALESKQPAITLAASRTGGNGMMQELTRIPLAGMRKTIARRMVEAKTQAAHTYAFFEIDVTKLLAARETMLGFEEEIGTRISLVSFYMRAVALACGQVPICNSTLVGEEIIVWQNVNIGVAVALPGRSKYESQLTVPVVRNVQEKGLLQIDREVKDLVKRARAGELQASDMEAGTITVSSTDGFLPGSWAVSTPLINLPQVVNFQPGTPLKKPVVIDDQIVVRTLLPCGLSFDHRAMDGEPVGRFNKALRDFLANPELMLL